MPVATRRKADYRGKVKRQIAREGLHWPSAQLLVGVCLAVFGHTLLNQFVDWDDHLLILRNPYLNPPTPGNLLRLWARPYAEVYNPLVYTAYGLQVALFGLRPFVFHAVNVSLHTASVLVLWRCLTLLLPQARWGPALGAMVFAIHPLQAEAVSWATGQKEVLAGFWCLAALWMYLRARFSQGPLVEKEDGAQKNNSSPADASRPTPPAVRSSRACWFAGGLLCFVLALLSKPSAATWPVAVLALEVLYLKEKPRSALIRLAPWLVAGAAALVLVSHIQPPTARLEASYPDWPARPLLAADSLTFYTTKVLVPTGLAPVYAKRPLQAAASWPAIAKLVVLVALLFLLFRRRTPWSASAAVFIIMLLPLLGFVPFMYQLYSTVADRYAYVALVGPALAVAGLITMAEQRKGVNITRLIVAWLIVLGGLAARQGYSWRTSETLWTHAMRVSPGSPVVHGSLANLHVAAGRRAEAMRALDDALWHDPNYSLGILNRAILLAAENKTDEAERGLRRAAAFEETAAAAWNALGNLKFDTDPEAAVAAFREALRRNPNLSDIHLKIAGIRWTQNRFDECEAELLAALKITPTSADAHTHLGTLRARQGRAAEARAAFERALKFNPNQAEARVGLAALDQAPPGR